MESPFHYKSWSTYGFEGPPEPGFDYSWIEVQWSLNFIGFENVVCSCTLYFSSRSPSIFLVKTADGCTELWDIRDCKFSLLAANSSILVVTCENFFHLSDVSASLIELLMKIKKLPSDSLRAQSSKSFPIVFDQVSKEIPQEATDLIESISPKPNLQLKPVVTVTGTNVDKDVIGELSISNDEIQVKNEETVFTINIKDVAKAETTKIGKIFIVLTFHNNEKNEITFQENNQDEAKGIFGRIEEELKRIQNNEN